MHDARAREALGGFIAELNQVRVNIGTPSLERLEKLTDPTEPRPAEFPAGQRVLHLPHSTMHDMLRGKRQSLPKWARVASYVTVLRAIAVHDGLDPDTHVGTLAHWKERHEAVRLIICRTSMPLAAPVWGASASTEPSSTAADPAEPTEGQTAAVARDAPEQASADSHDAKESPAELPRSTVVDLGNAGEVRFGGSDLGAVATKADLSPASPVLVALLPSATPMRPTQRSPVDLPVPGMPAPVAVPVLTLEQLRIARAFGRTGLRLLRWAERITEEQAGAEAAEAALRLAALLACHDRVNEGIFWLIRAARAGHPHARQLIMSDLQQPHYWTAAEVAFDIALSYERRRLRSSALVFFRAAARNGHTHATYHLGMHYLKAGDRWRALEAFEHAATNGHVGAQLELHALVRHRQRGSAASGASPSDLPT